MEHTQINQKTIEAYSLYSRFYAVIALLTYWIIWRGNLTRHIRFFREILKYDRKLLDIATGDGSLTKAALFTKKHERADALTAVDISDAMLNKARKKLPPHVVFVNADVAKLPFATESRNAISCFGGLNSFPSCLQAFLELKRILKPGGYLRGSFLLFPATPWKQKLVRRWIAQGYQTGELSLEIFYSWVEDSGLQLTHCEQHGDVVLFELRKTDPVTYENPTLPFAKDRKNLWTRDSVEERFPHAMTPMGYSMIKGVLEHSLASLKDFLPITCSQLDKAFSFYQGFVYKNERYMRYPYCRLKLSNFSFSLKKILSSFVFFFSTRLSQTKGMFLLYCVHHLFLARNSGKALKEWHAGLSFHLSKVRAFSSTLDGPKEHRSASSLKKIEELRQLSFEYFKTDIAIHLSKDVYIKLLSRIFLKMGYQDNDFYPWMGRFYTNPTLRFHDDFNKVQSGSAEEKSVFLSEYGHMTSSWDVLHPCLSEDMGKLLIKNPSSRTKPRDLRRSFSEFSSKMFSPLKKTHRLLLLQATRRCRELSQADEAQHFYAGLYIQKSRDLLLSIAEHLVAIKSLHTLNDVFFYPLRS
jgi:ubiquinone/menaquinone biosynthesis C-methylase UbiE